MLPQAPALGVEAELTAEANLCLGVFAPPCFRCRRQRSAMQALLQERFDVCVSISQINRCRNKHEAAP